MTSALFSVAGSVAQVAQVVAHGSTTALVIANTSGIDTVEWTVVGKSHASTAVTITPVGKGHTATITFPADPGYDHAVLLEAKGNGGRGPTGTHDANLICRRVIGTKTYGAIVPVCANEEFERDAVVGWTKAVNEDFDLLPRWRRKVDVDFSTLANQSITSNGAVTLGGTTFQIENIGSLYAAYTAVFGIVNGAGFRVPSHASGSVLAGKTARTLPMISWQLPSTVKANVGVRAVAQFANSSSTSAASIMLEYGSASPTVVNKYNMVTFGASGVISASGCQIGRTQTTDAFTSYTTDGTADISGFTTGIEGATLLNGFTALFDTSSAANLSDLDTVPRTLRDNTGMVGPVPLTTVGRMSNWRVAVAFGQTTPAVGSYATMKRLIIELYY